MTEEADARIDEPSPKRVRSDGDAVPEKGNCTVQMEQDNETARAPLKVKRPPFSKTHKIFRSGGKFHLLLGVTGSVATIKLQELIEQLYKICDKDRLWIKVVATACGMQFVEKSELEISEIIYDDRDEWNMWKGRGDPVLHIELRKWADAMLIAPLDANSLAKIACGLCDNLLTSVVRAWDPSKPLHFAPAMNTCMWESPLTFSQRATLKDILRFKEIPPMQKDLICGDHGMGAMASVQMIVSIIGSLVKNKFAVYTA